MISKEGVTIMLESKEPRNKLKEKALEGVCYTLAKVEENNLWMLFSTLMEKVVKLMERAI